MYIRRKVYSEPQETLYSVTMSEEEFDLFSEFQESLYARKDYEGLSEVEKQELRKVRREYAKNLRESKDRASFTRWNIQTSPFANDQSGLLHSREQNLGGHSLGNHRLQWGFDVDLDCDPKITKHQQADIFYKSKIDDMLKRADKNKPEMISLAKDNAKQRIENSKRSIAIHEKRAQILRNIRKAKRIGLGLVGTAGLAYGGKKVYDHYKASKSE